MLGQGKFIYDYKGRKVTVYSDKFPDKTGVITSVVRVPGEVSYFIELDNGIVINTRYITYFEVIG